MTLLEILHWLVEANKFAAPAERALIHEAVDNLEQPRHAPSAGANEAPATPAPVPAPDATQAPGYGGQDGGYTEPGTTSGEE